MEPNREPIFSDPIISVLVSVTLVRFSVNYAHLELKWSKMYEHEHKGRSFGVYAFRGALLNKRFGILVACAQHASHGASVCPAPKCFQEDMDRPGREMGVAALRISGPMVPHPASIWYCTKEPF